MFKRLKNSALHSGAEPVKFKVDVYLDEVTGLPPTARGAVVTFGRGSKWQTTKEALAVQGAADGQPADNSLSSYPVGMRARMPLAPHLL